MNINLRHWKIEDAKDYIEFMLSSDKNKNFSFAIAFDNKVVGNIGIFRKENIHYRTGELGYYISKITGEKV